MGGLIERGFKREFTSVVRARTYLGSWFRFSRLLFAKFVG